MDPDDKEYRKKRELDKAKADAIDAKHERRMMLRHGEQFQAGKFMKSLAKEKRANRKINRLEDTRPMRERIKSGFDKLESSMEKVNNYQPPMDPMKGMIGQEDDGWRDPFGTGNVGKSATKKHSRDPFGMGF